MTVGRRYIYSNQLQKHMKNLGGWGCKTYKFVLSLHTPDMVVEQPLPLQMVALRIVVLLCHVP